ncbi:hypothetical protein C8J57DRAFT_1504395 [Mycena rebaudengoi]|nr:hypothetical protein C8J57DRAFT_1504395 [Mycena rebaudengoi]
MRWPRIRGRPRAKLKPPNRTSALPDVLWTSLHALKESADAFPPLKSVVGGVVVIWNIAERAKHSKTDARATLRSGRRRSSISSSRTAQIYLPPMLQSIERFTERF